MYNPLTVCLSSAQLLNAERKARKAAYIIFKVFGMTQLRTKPSHNSKIIVLSGNAEQWRSKGRGKVGTRAPGCRPWGRMPPLAFPYAHAPTFSDI